MRNSFLNNDRTSFADAYNLSAGHSLCRKWLSVANFTDGSEIVMGLYFIYLPANTSSVCPTKKRFGPTGEGGPPTIARHTIEHDQTPARLMQLSTECPNDSFALHP